jgi:hypothetical protein
MRTLLAYNVGREKFDAVLVNTTPIPEELIRLYAEKDRSTPILYSSSDVDEIGKYAKNVGAGDLLSRGSLNQKLVRHGVSKLAKAIVEF